MAEDDEILGNNNGGQKEIAVTTSRRSLCFKLKIPNSEPKAVFFQDPTTSQNQGQEVEEEEEEEEEEEALAFVCPVCDKRFKSGKALGGHKRMHNMSKKASTVHGDEENEEEEEEEEDAVVCPQCSKSFRSKKSLFGHMRSHPERSWRGIQPPNNNNSSCSVSESPPFGWSLTGKRSRKSTTSSSSSASAEWSSESRQFVVPGMDEDMKEAVLDLMLLAHYKPKKNVFALELEEDDDDDDQHRNSSEDCSDTTKKKLKGKRPKMKLVDRIQIKEEEDGDIQDQLEDELEIIASSSKQNKNDIEEENNKKKKKKKKKNNIEDDETKRYVCSACDKSFASYQALGGHRSSHNKHFSHLNNKTKTQHRVFNFDLNEPPPPEDES